MIRFPNQKSRQIVVSSMVVAAVGAILLVARASAPGSVTGLVAAAAPTPFACPIPSAPPTSNYKLNDNNTICFSNVPQAVVDSLPALSQLPDTSAVVGEAGAQSAAPEAFKGMILADQDGKLLSASSLELVGRVLARADLNFGDGPQAYWIFIYHAASGIQHFCGASELEQAGTNVVFGSPSSGCGSTHYLVAAVNASNGLVDRNLAPEVDNS